MAAPRSSNFFLYLLIAVCLILLAPYFGIHLFVTESPEPLESSGSDSAINRELSTSKEQDAQGVKPSKALSDIEDLLER